MIRPAVKLNYVACCLKSRSVGRVVSQRFIATILPFLTICNHRRFYSSYSQFQLFYNYEGITSEVINKLLVNQSVYITQEELEKLKSIPGVKYNLPLNDDTARAFIGLVGRSNSRINRAGVYIFTHLATGSKYVGSSNSLARRLFGYFRHEYNEKENSGLLLPLLRKEGVAAFSLEIFIIPISYPSNSYLFLEQYHLLNQKFDLNTQRVVQFRALRPHVIYLYDKEGKILYYSSESYSQIQKDLGLHYSVYKKCIDQGNSYLNFERCA